jgi:hypothetical protein
MTHCTRSSAIAALVMLAGTSACPFLMPPIDDDSAETRRSRDDDEERGGGGQVCSVADDCPNIACICDDGSALGAPVNSRRCVNDRCQLAAASCPASCAAFDMEWTGEVFGNSANSNDNRNNNQNNNNADDDNGGGGGSPGDSCGDSSDCAAHSCVCPDGNEYAISDCWDNVCYGASECSTQCCELGHC